MKEARTAGGESTAARRVWIVRVAGAGLILLTAWHLAASFLWIFPPSPLRQLVPGNALSSYMLPLFGQSWSVFAPEPINGDHHFNVRARIESDGTVITTGWVSATEVELSMVRYNLFPPRAGVQAEELASEHKRAWEQLDSAQREVIAVDHTSDNWLDELAEDLDSAESEAASAATAYLEVDRMATAYATQVARAIWGDGVIDVQYRVSRQNVVPFAQRNDANATPADPTIILPGWRSPLVEPGQDEGHFAELFRDQYEYVIQGAAR